MSRVTHTWFKTRRDDRQVCIDCGTARWLRFIASAFECFLYKPPGETHWLRGSPDCAAVAADKMRTDRMAT